MVIASECRLSASSLVNLLYACTVSNQHALSDLVLESCRNWHDLPFDAEEKVVELEKKLEVSESSSSSEEEPNILTMESMAFASGKIAYIQRS